VGGQTGLAAAGVSDKLGHTIANLLGWLPLLLALIAFPDGRYFPKITAAAVVLVLLATMNVLWWRLDGADSAAFALSFILAAAALGVPGLFRGHIFGDHGLAAARRGQPAISRRSALGGVAPDHRQHFRGPELPVHGARADGVGVSLPALRRRHGDRPIGSLWRAD